MNDKIEKLITEYQETINNNNQHANKMYADDLKDAVRENMTLEGVIDDLKAILNEAIGSEEKNCSSCLNTDYISTYSPCYGCVDFSKWMSNFNEA